MSSRIDSYIECNISSSSSEGGRLISSLSEMFGSEIVPELCTEAFRDYPGTELWRLFIDLNRQMEGPWVFDVKEPGYLMNLYRAFARAMQSLGAPCSSATLQMWHDDAVRTVRRVIPSSEDSAAASEPFQSGYSLEYSYPLTRPVTKKARQEWESQKLIVKTTYINSSHRAYLATYDPENGMVFPLRKTDFEDALEGQVDHFFQLYYQRMAGLQGTSQDGQLSAMVDLCRALEIVHPFPDGNQRTITQILLNQLLIETHLSPVVLEYPDLFDGCFSTQEMVGLLRRGMAHFACIKHQAQEHCEHLLRACL